MEYVFRAELAAALKKARLLEQAPSQVWGKNWVVHCQPAGSGQKVLRYLARYVFRIALANSRLETIDSAHVTFRYRDNRSQRMRRITLTGVEFIRRFLLHVLPPRCSKVRHYGICASSSRRRLDRARVLLGAPPPAESERERIPWVLASDPGAIYADAGPSASLTRASTSLPGPSHT